MFIFKHSSRKCYHIKTLNAAKYIFNDKGSAMRDRRHDISRNIIGNVISLPWQPKGVN